jgi:hypothetical protein
MSIISDSAPIAADAPVNIEQLRTLLNMYGQEIRAVWMKSLFQGPTPLIRHRSNPVTLVRNEHAGTCQPL